MLSIISWSPYELFLYLLQYGLAACFLKIAHELQQLSMGCIPSKAQVDNETRPVDPEDTLAIRLGLKKKPKPAYTVGTDVTPPWVAGHPRMRVEKDGASVQYL